MYKLNHWRKQEIGNLPAQTALFTTPEQHFMYDSLTMYKRQLKTYRQQTAFLNTVTPNFLTREVSHFTYTPQQHNQASIPQDVKIHAIFHRTDYFGPHIRPGSGGPIDLRKTLCACAAILIPWARYRSCKYIRPRDWRLFPISTYRGSMWCFNNETSLP